MGACDLENSHAMLDFFYENGGNFIDTYINVLSGLEGIHIYSPSHRANNYH